MTILIQIKNQNRIKQRKKTPLNTNYWSLSALEVKKVEKRHFQKMIFKKLLCKNALMMVNRTLSCGFNKMIMTNTMNQGRRLSMMSFLVTFNRKKRQ